MSEANNNDAPHQEGGESGTVDSNDSDREDTRGTRHSKGSPRHGNGRSHGGWF